MGDAISFQGSCILSLILKPNISMWPLVFFLMVPNLLTYCNHQWISHHSQVGFLKLEPKIQVPFFWSSFDILGNGMADVELFHRWSYTMCLTLPLSLPNHSWKMQDWQSWVQHATNEFWVLCSQLEEQQGYLFLFFLELRTWGTIL